MHQDTSHEAIRLNRITTSFAVWKRQKYHRRRTVVVCIKLYLSFTYMLMQHTFINATKLAHSRTHTRNTLRYFCIAQQNHHAHRNDFTALAFRFVEQPGNIHPYTWQENWRHNLFHLSIHHPVTIFTIVPCNDFVAI